MKAVDWIVRLICVNCNYSINVCHNENIVNCNYLINTCFYENIVRSVVLFVSSKYTENTNLFGKNNLYVYMCIYIIYFTKFLTESIDNDICKNKPWNILYSRLFKTSFLLVVSNCAK